MSKQVAALKAQLEHLEVSIKEARKISSEHENISELNGQKFQEAQMELNKRLNNEVQIEVIEKDRDERIKALRDESDRL